MRYPQDLVDWPLAEHSEIIDRPNVRWHVQRSGTGPMLLLIHGAGGSTHSWRGLFPILANDFDVIALDLPGQGFSTASHRQFGLTEMVGDLLDLVGSQNWVPDALVGHSAGGAIAMELAPALDPIPSVITINASLGRFEGPASWLFPLLAKAMALNPLTVPFFVATSGPASTARLIRGLGSDIGKEGEALYTRLTTDRAHVGGTLDMMARWSVDDLLDRLPSLRFPVSLIVSTGDKAVPPDQSRQAAARIPGARLVEVPNLGHLAHEEAPEHFAQIISEEFTALRMQVLS